MRDHAGCTMSPLVPHLFGCAIFLVASSEMWIQASMPSSISAKATKCQLGDLARTSSPTWYLSRSSSRARLEPLDAQADLADLLVTLRTRPRHHVTLRGPCWDERLPQASSERWTRPAAPPRSTKARVADAAHPALTRSRPRELGEQALLLLTRAARRWPPLRQDEPVALASVT